jgi:hypothetical protein
MAAIHIKSGVTGFHAQITWLWMIRACTESSHGVTNRSSHIGMMFPDVNRTLANM